MKVCKNCGHQKKFHSCVFGCMDIIEDSTGMFLGSRKWICDCLGWNIKGRGIKVLLPQ